MQWLKLLPPHSDPGQHVNIHVRVMETAGWLFTLSFRDWLRADKEHMRRYAAEKLRIAAKYSSDMNALNYAAEKKLWFREYVEPQLYAWVDRNRWRPDSQVDLHRDSHCPAGVKSHPLNDLNTVRAPELSPTAIRLPSWPQTIADVG
jgi:hypothetical protein